MKLKLLHDIMQEEWNKLLIFEIVSSALFCIAVCMLVFIFKF